MLSPITRESLMPLEVYARARNEFRARVIAHKKRRTVHLGGNITLIFEDELTIRYQIQEMLRIEKIFEDEGIEGELSAYNPLVPNGTNWKATMLLEYPDLEERKRVLPQLIGVEDRVWVRVEGFDRVYAIADEDLERSNQDKTASVHFLRFELTAAMGSALAAGAGLAVGVDHPNCNVSITITDPAVKSSLLEDLHLQ